MVESEPACGVVIVRDVGDLATPLVLVGREGGRFALQ